MFTFDGVNRTITINDNSIVNGVVGFTPQELWTAYVDWSVVSDNLKFYRYNAMDILMVQLSETELLGAYLFFRNDFGWRIIPPTLSSGVSIVIDGSLYGKDSTLPIMENVTAQETDLVINRATLTNTVVSGANSYSLEEIADAVWLRNTRDITNTDIIATKVWDYQL